MTDLNRQFLERVVVWPGAKEAPGWVNLHTHLKNADPAKNGGKPFVVGWPFKTVEDFISRAAWAETTDSFFDIWYCTSQQREAGKNSKGNPKAVRLAKNATWLKALWFDIDIKPEDQSGKHYTTLADAVAALRAFRAKVGLPGPTAMVDSGGGLHIYWISSSPLTPEQWRPYAEGLKALALAEGLKCDTGLTTDNVRILRVPGTLNHKYSPPRRVALLGGKLGRDYNFDTDLLFLKDFATTQVKSSQQFSTTLVTADPVVPGAVFTAPDPAFAGLTGGEALAAGIEATGPKLVDPLPILAKCAFLGDAFKNGGKDYDQPLWNLSVLCTVFMEDGNALAHEISKGHPGYAPVGTQALYDRKVADRSERGIGYPSCAAIEGAGCKACATCPLKPQGKSPLNIRAPQSAVTATVTRSQSAAAASLRMPDPYDLDDEGYINEIVQTVLKSGDVQEKWCRLFMCRITEAWASKNPTALNLYISLDLGNWDWVSLKMTDWSGPGFEKRLSEKDIKYNPEHKLRLEKFFMSFLAKMHAEAASTPAVSFGWYRPTGQVEGFAYGKHIYKTDGTTVPATLSDHTLQARFTPTGSTDPWYTAFSYIVRQKRPELEVMTAVAFAAPLIELTGTTGALLSVAGDSGAGKSFALEVGQAVWGHPKQAKDNANSTEKSVLHRLGVTVNLPAYWDEITEEEHQHKLLKFLMMSTGGGEGGRMTSHITQRERGTWSTIVALSSNRMFRDFIVKKQRDHGAALMRTLEYWVAVNPTNAVGQVAPSEPDRALADLKHNFGVVGCEYAKLLAHNFPKIEKMVHANLTMIEKKLQPDKAERMWIGLMASMLTGAQCANMLPRPVGFDVPALFDFLVSVYKENKQYRDSANVNPSQTDYAEDFLVQYLKEHQLETIRTKGAPSGPGGKQTIPWELLNPNAPRPKSYNVRFDYLNNEMWISQTNFKQWCELAHPDAGRNFRSIITAIKNTYKMTEAKKVLAGGTPFKVGQERVFVINVAPFPDLLAALYPDGVDNTALGHSTGALPTSTGADANVQGNSGQDTRPGPDTDIGAGRVDTGLVEASGTVQ